MNKFDYIFFCGDIHGEYDVIPNFIRDHKLYNVAVIVVGDFGIGFEVMKTEIKRLNYLNNRMKHTNSKLFAIRGNHDNPLYFTGEFDKSNVKLLPDYTILNLNDNNILCIGGAISVDRKQRKSYFKPARRPERFCKPPSPQTNTAKELGLTQRQVSRVKQSALEELRKNL